MNKSTVAHTNETATATTTVPERGRHAVVARSAEYVSAEALVLSQGARFPLCEIHKATLGDLLPLLLDVESNGSDLADAALNGIKEDLEVLGFAAEDMESEDVVHILIKLQERAAIASEIHRRMMTHRRGSAEATASSPEPSGGHGPRGGEPWEVGAMERAFHGVREAVDHLQICLTDALKDEPPAGIEECAAAALEDVARWSLDFRTSLACVRGLVARGAAKIDGAVVS